MMNYKDFVKVIAAMIISGAFAQYVMTETLAFPTWMSLICSCTVTLIVYIFLMFVMKIIRKEDLSRIPYIGKWFTLTT